MGGAEGEGTQGLCDRSIPFYADQCQSSRPLGEQHYNLPDDKPVRNLTALMLQDDKSVRYFVTLVLLDAESVRDLTTTNR